jgi:hypothetical protein
MKITLRLKRELNPAFKRFQRLPELGMCRPPAPAQAGLAPVVLGGTSRGVGSLMPPSATSAGSGPTLQPEASGPI